MKKLHVITYSLIVAGLMAPSISFSQMTDSQMRKGVEFGTEFHFKKLHESLQQFKEIKAKLIAALNEKIEAAKDTPRLAGILQKIKDRIEGITEDDVNKFEAKIKSVVDQIKEARDLDPSDKAKLEGILPFHKSATE